MNLGKRSDWGLVLLVKKFLSYYKPYLRTFSIVLFFAFAASAIALVLPLFTRYITKTVLAGDLTEALGEIYRVGVLMVGLVVLQTICNYIFDYYGHAIGAQMESDMRTELFEHYQKLPLGFYDEERTGELMSRLTNDLLSLAEMCHHAPEDLIMNTVKFVGAGVILFTINGKLTAVVFSFLPVIGVFAFLMSKRMYRIQKRNRERIGDVNAQVEDNLSGMRVVKSFTGESMEKETEKMRVSLSAEKISIGTNPIFIRASALLLS